MDLVTGGLKNFRARSRRNSKGTLSTPSELLLDIARESTLMLLARFGEKGFEVIGDDAIEDPIRRAVLLVGG